MISYFFSFHIRNVATFLYIAYFKSLYLFFFFVDDGCFATMIEIHVKYSKSGFAYLGVSLCYCNGNSLMVYNFLSVMSKSI